MLLIAYIMMCRVCRVCAKRIYRNANLVDVRALSSNGRAPASHAGGRGIDTPSVHALQPLTFPLSTSTVGIGL